MISKPFYGGYTFKMVYKDSFLGTGLNGEVVSLLELSLKTSRYSLHQKKRAHVEGSHVLLRARKRHDLEVYVCHTLLVLSAVNQVFSVCVSKAQSSGILCLDTKVNCPVSFNRFTRLPVSMFY